ncbi:30405_t:CDS:2, partial [Gigaspora margarita]
TCEKVIGNHLTLFEFSFKSLLQSGTNIVNGLYDFASFFKMQTSINLNSTMEVEYDDEYDEPLELYKGQIFKTTEEAHATIETFANSHGFEIRKEHVEKDTNHYEIARTFLCRHARKLSTEKTSHKTKASGSCQTDCK